MYDLEPASKVVTNALGPLCGLKTDGSVWCRGLWGSGTPHARPGDQANLVEFIENR